MYSVRLPYPQTDILELTDQVKLTQNRRYPECYESCDLDSASYEQSPWFSARAWYDSRHSINPEELVRRCCCERVLLSPPPPPHAPPPFLERPGKTHSGRQINRAKCQATSIGIYMWIVQAFLSKLQKNYRIQLQTHVNVHVLASSAHCYDTNKRYDISRCHRGSVVRIFLHRCWHKNWVISRGIVGGDDSVRTGMTILTATIYRGILWYGLGLRGVGGKPIRLGDQWQLSPNNHKVTRGIPGAPGHSWKFKFTGKKLHAAS